MTTDAFRQLRPGDAVLWKVRGVAPVAGRVMLVRADGLVTIRWADGETSTRHPDDCDDFAAHLGLDKTEDA